MENPYDKLWEELASEYHLRKISRIVYKKENETYTPVLVSIGKGYEDIEFEINKEYNENKGNYCLPLFISIPPAPEIPVQFCNSQYESVNNNINRVMRLFQKLISIEDFNHNLINLDKHLFCETILILLNTTTEVYLKDKFRRLASEITIKNVEKKELNKFIHDFGYGKSSKILFEHLKEKKLNEILPEYLDFQKPPKIKKSFKLIGIELPEIEKNLWDRNFLLKDSYREIRNTLVHSGSFIFQRGIKMELVEKMNVQYIYEAIINTVKFIYLVECKCYEFFGALTDFSQSSLKLNDVNKIYFGRSDKKEH
jgi:hypothetical protein